MPDETAIEKVETGPAGVRNFGADMQLNNIDDAWRVAQYIVRSGFAPRGMEKPEAVLVAMQLGAEIGLSPMTSVQNIASINGRPSIYGQAALALVRASGELESYHSEFVGNEFDDNFKCVIRSKRVGMDEMVTEFSVGDAKRAKLWGKAGPWTQYPKRMIMWRARGFNLNDNFGDILKGMITREEAIDLPPVNVTSDGSDHAVDGLKAEVASMPAPVVEPTPEPVEAEVVKTANAPEPEPEAETPAPEAKAAKEPEAATVTEVLEALGINRAMLVGFLKENHERVGLEAFGSLADIPAALRNHMVKNPESFKRSISAWFDAKTEANG